MGKLNNGALLDAINNSTNIESARRNLAGDNPRKTDYITAATNIVEAGTNTFQALKKYLPAAQSANLGASLYKITDGLQNGNLRVSDVVSFAGDLVGALANNPAIPLNVKLALYATSAGLTALSWGISEFEDASEAGEKERERLEKLFDDCKAEVDNMWSNENWEDKNGLFLLYKVYSASAVENKGNMRFKIEFNHELDKDITMSYYTVSDKDGAKQGVDYVGVSDKNPTTFTVPKGAKEWYIDIPIIDDSEKESDEEFMLVIDYESYSGKYPFVYGYGNATGTIIDDESPAIITISNAIANEADAEINFNITLNRALDKDITLNVEPFMLDSSNSNVKNTASYDDFTNIPTSVTIKAGETNATYTMQIKDDKFPENTESFGLWFKPSENDIQQYGFKKEYVVNGKIIDDDESIVTVNFLDNSSAEGNNKKESQECQVQVSGLENLAPNQRVEVFADTGNKDEADVLTFYANSDSSGKYTFYWEGDEIPNGDRTYLLSGSAYIVTTDEDGYETIEYAKVDSGILKIKDDDRDPDDDLPETYDPLVIDLNNDGIKGTSLDYSINFDLNSDGFKESSSWISKDDAFIAIDKNANGIIDNGSELFGDKSVSNSYYAYTSPTSKNGFEALKEYDGDNNNIIDINDKEFANLLLWQDLNSDGISQSNEIIKLSDKVKSINLAYTANGNTEISNATLQDGSSAKVQDMYFSVDLKKTDEIIDENQIPFEIQSLPNVVATGNLHSLHSAMAKNETLATMMNLYLLMDSDTRKANINSLIYEWAGVSDIAPNARTSSMDSRQLSIYEKLQGKPFTWHGVFDDSQIYRSANILKDRYQSFANFVYASLELQTTYSYLNLDFEILKFDENLGKYSYDFNALNYIIEALYDNNQLDEISNLSSIIRTALTYKPFAYNLLKENYANNFSGELLALLYGTHITGTNGNDTLNGTNEANYLNGLGGDDTLKGGSGDDIYSFSDEFGKDTIYDVSGNDTIYLDINSDKILLQREFEDLIIKTKDETGRLTNNQITIQNFFSINPDLGNGVIENIKFSDGTIWTTSQILANAPLKGTNESDKFYLTDSNDNFNAFGGDDIIYGGNGNDYISGGSGDDMLYGDSGDDIIFGESGNDNIYGGDGNDTLIGGSGDDFLQGGQGSDTYIFNGKFDNDTVLNFKPNKDETDTIKFIDLRAKDLNFKREFDGKDFSNDLVITTKNGSVKVQNFFDESSINENYKIDKIHTQDKILTPNEIKEILTQKSLYNDEIMAFNNQIQINGGFGDDILKASKSGTILNGEMGNDILISNTGNDTLKGGYGNDKFIYARNGGSDIIQDNGGSDTLVLKGISKDEANFTQSGKDLIISFNFNDDKITIKNHFKWLFGKPNKIENIIFDKDENLTISQIDEFIANKWNKITYNDISNKFNSNISESVGEFISQEKIDKIIEQVNTYSTDSGLGNFAFNDIQNSQNLQLYGV